jgi:hypothetical protein
LNIKFQRNRYGSRQGPESARENKSYIFVISVVNGRQMD